MVADVRAPLQWYQGKLGLHAERFAEWEAGEAPFVSLRVRDSMIIDLIEEETGGEKSDMNAGGTFGEIPSSTCRVQHVCFEVAQTDLEELAREADTAEAFDVVAAPRQLHGAQGAGPGMYVRDPDGNIIEFRHYGTV